MSDPDRLLDHASGIEARLLSAGRNEEPPPDLLARTLDAASAAAGAAAAGAAVNAAVNAAAKHAANTALGAPAGVLSGLWGAIGIGALAGVATIGIHALATRDAPSGPAGAARPPAAIVAPVASSPVDRAAPPPRLDPEQAPSSAASTRPPATGSAAMSPLANELALLDEARAALRRGDRDGARAALDRYAREIPRGQLSREAAMLRAEADQPIDAGRTIP